jgi:predicted membrane channel-forming protein YqfA (hemolysin III family)
MMKRRTFNAIFITVSVAAFLPLIFPIYEIANKTEPLVLGLPFGFFWIVLWVLIVFIAAIILYFLDPENKKQESDH